MLLRTCKCFLRERECFWPVLEAWGSRQLLSLFLRAVHYSSVPPIPFEDLMVHFLSPPNEEKQLIIMLRRCNVMGFLFFNCSNS
ncbi:hypothetical protein T11_12489 [Trichinella zimbabwensis]|uniref:Uncharacterized protein n=1 Tax=Trichinella zimbabwensis TaxID=268475 RepID=A0A0V1GWW2_9BILA|nr:hypothetical protein T11_12489 [Trichinella zimbabwensis]